MPSDAQILYSLDHDGHYTLNFPNRYALTNAEITKRFSSYGNVLSVRNAGDERGFRFVRYATKNEAIAAIEGLKNDREIRLVQRKPKIKDNTNHNNNYNQFKKNDSSSRSSNNSDKNKKNSPIKHNSRDDDNSSQCSQRMSRTLETKNNDIDCTLDKLNTKKCLILDSFNTNKTEENEFQGMPALELKAQSAVPEMPCLVPAKKIPKREVILAQEIIFANVHDNYGCAFILHLLEKYDPIAITKMNITNNTNLRYCHVYFKTFNDAEAVIEDFDNYVLLGKKLIVIRPE